MDDGQAEDGPATLRVRESGSRLFQQLFTASPLPMWLYDPADLSFVEVNDAAVATYGYSREQFKAMTLLDIRPDEDAPRLQASVVETVQANRGYALSQGWRHRLSDGSLRWVNIGSTPFDYDGRQLQMISVHDVTPLRHAVDRAERHADLFEQLFRNTPEASVMLDAHYHVLEANPAFEDLFGLRVADIRGHCIETLIVPPERLDEGRRLLRQGLEGRAVRQETLCLRGDGSRVEVSMLGFPVKLQDAQPGLFAIYRDVTESRRLRQQLAYHTSHDLLTGLYNRHEFERLVRISGAASRNAALIYIDIDQLRAINDQHGFAAGDRTLSGVVEFLRGCLREHDMLARVGGDEFCALLRPCGLDEAEQIARRIADESERLQGFPMPLRLKLGVVALPPEVQDIGQALSAAEAACHAVRRSASGRVYVFRDGDVEVGAMREELSWIKRLRQAVADNRLLLYYQEIRPLDLADPLRHCELLVRLRDTDGSIVLPSRFIPAAERYGLMPEIDRAVLTAAFEAIASGRRRLDPHQVLCLNISGASLGDAGFGRYVTALIARAGVPPSQLCFEITETASLSNTGGALEFIAQMRNIGAKVALDDFGVGLSSFAYLKMLSADYLKIDGSFISDLEQSPLDRATVEAITMVAKVKGMRTVAEYVGSESLLNLLRELGVDYAQGFFLHKPEPWLV